MADEIRPVGTADTSSAASRDGDDGVGDLKPHSGCPSWTVVQYKSHYLGSLDARRFSATISDGRNRTMFGWRGTRPDTDLGAWERGFGCERKMTTPNVRKLSFINIRYCLRC